MSERPEVHPAANWSRATWKVENAQTGRAKPTSHSKRIKAKRKATRA